MRKCFILLFLLGACSPGKNISGFDGPLKEGNILDINRKVIAQQFDMDRRGNAYYAQIDPPDYYGVSIFRVDRDSLNRDSVAAPCPGQRMTLLYAGHPTGMAVEDAKDGPYIWIGNYASKVRSKSYWQTQTVCRVRYEAGKTFRPEELEHFWFPHVGDINVALDRKNDLLAFSCYRVDETEAGIPKDRSRRIRIYRLSEALATPLEEVTLPYPWIRGGEGAPDPADTLEVTCKVHNLGRLEPVAEIGTHTGGNNPEGINSTAWQGFDVDGDRIWFSEGSGKTGAFLTGYDFSGNVVFHRKEIAIARECPDWKTWGISDSEAASVENEGVRVWNGRIYLGFFSFRSGDGWRSNILAYPLPE